MSNSLVRIIGHIRSAKLIKQEHKLSDPNPLYKVYLEPEDYNDFQDLETQVLEFKRDWEMNRPYRPHEDELPSPGIKFKDRHIVGCSIVFETEFDPMSKLQGKFKEFERDEEFYLQRCQVTGHLQMMKGGNVFISFHFIDPLEDEVYEPPTGGEDDDGMF